MPVRTVEKVEFGPFVFDLRTGRLEKHGYTVKLQPKCGVVLACLLERRGEVVTREELRARLWPSGTFVDFDLGIKVALKKLRDALGDSHEEPKYIQTVRGEGYRFVGQVTELAVAPATVSEVPAAAVEPRRNWMLWAGVAAAVAVAFGIGVFFASRKPAIQFHSSDWVLIADFDNRTGEKVLDGTLEYAVERELSNSQFVNVVPRERVQDALRLMKKPLDTKLDRATAREVCLRDGAIRAVLVGRVEKIGTNYELSVQIVDPARDVAVAGYTEEDPADTLLAGTVRKLSTRVREALGEQMAAIQQSREQLAKVTTPSLRALQLYTQADRAFAPQVDDDSSRIAAALLEQALKEDPDFASAHVLLAYAYWFQHKQDQAAPHFRRAFELADKTTERERYFILASYYQHSPVDQPEKAAELYEALVRRYPAHRWQVSMLAGLYMRLQQPEKLDDLSIRMADLRPNDPRPQVLAAWNLAVREIHRAAPKPGVPASSPDFSRVDHYLARANALKNTHALDEPDDLSVRWYTAQIHWMEGRFAESHTDALDAGSDKGVDSAEMAKFYAAFGNLHEADKRIPIDQASLHAMLAYYRGDVDEVRRSLRGHRITPVFSWIAGPSALMMAHAGLVRDAEAVRGDLADFVQKVRRTAPRRAAEDVLLRIVEGEISVAKGNASNGNAQLEKALADADDPSNICNLMASEDLAQAYRKQGKTADAIRVLERATSGPVWPSNFSAAWQQRLLLQLAQLYREAGRGQDAQRVEALLAKELAFADADHPISRQLAALAKLPASTAKKPVPLS